MKAHLNWYYTIKLQSFGSEFIKFKNQILTKNVLMLNFLPFYLLAIAKIWITQFTKVGIVCLRLWRDSMFTWHFEQLPVDLSKCPPYHAGTLDITRCPGHNLYKMILQAFSFFKFDSKYSTLTCLKEIKAF